VCHLPPEWLVAGLTKLVKKLDETGEHMSMVLCLILKRMGSSH
jgi:hypothetical protein